MTSLSFYHMLEYLFVARNHILSLTWDSFLLNQSKAYVGAMLFSIMEFSVINKFRETYLFAIPDIALDILFKLGCCMIIVGHIFRTTAEFTAAKSFNHMIQDDKEDTHKLVTHGIYSLARHPSYFGWMLWAVGT